MTVTANLKGGVGKMLSIASSVVAPVCHGGVGASMRDNN